MNKICGYAWGGLAITPVGEVSMCCLQEKLSSLGPDSNLNSIRTSDLWNDIRKSMLQGEKHPSCNKCWTIEEENLIPSGRQSFNSAYPDFIEEIENKNSHRLSDDKIYHLDFRQSNLCNMKCISCNPTYSSLWNAEKIKSDGQTGNGVIEVKNENIKYEIFKNIDHLKEIYFAGGEPLINPTHWEILERLVHDGTSKTAITYNTNLLKLTYGGKHVFDYWDKIKRLEIGASIDAIGHRAEYVRTGTKWKLLNKNVIDTCKRYPNSFNIDTTISALNVGGIVELFKYANKIGVNKHRWNNFVFYPNYLHVSVLPLAYRLQILNQVKNYFENTPTAYSLNNFENFSKEMSAPQASVEDRTQFKIQIEYLDKIRNTSIFDSCPEFKDLWELI